ncbi:hypothetical protein [Ruminococcus sp. 210702-SL.1.03]|jgi:hypothetical protein|uniref:hypothetical protein n=1 Tax=Ruminococcus sp. 210702-SL.1.03 TaxID=2883233 RepID=UPI001D0980E4|nr:hypothetical protein [Ruminococcus sp. 210702-SL.1.03]MCB6616064.1 hypothetical protein [Ruminococcus sp. 210702-SL.1.03]
MADTNVNALKRLWAAIKGSGATADDLTADTTAAVIDAITAAYKGEEPQTLGALTVTSTAGTTTGKTKIEVSGNGSGALVYKLNNSTLPEYGEKLTGWTAWNGSDEIEAEDGIYITVCETDSAGGAVAGGKTTVNANLG